MLQAVVSKLQPVSASPGEFIKLLFARCHSRASDSVGLGQALRFCISKDILGDADIAGWGVGSTLWDAFA